LPESAGAGFMIRPMAWANRYQRACLLTSCAVPRPVGRS
jgi:hypothetical protein